MNKFEIPEFPDKYHPRASGAQTTYPMNYPMACDVSGSGTTLAIGYESKDLPDLWVCAICDSAYHRMLVHLSTIGSWPYA